MRTLTVRHERIAANVDYWIVSTFDALTGSRSTRWIDNAREMIAVVGNLIGMGFRAI